jgi:predicted metal-dependent hydrolase
MKKGQIKIEYAIRVSHRAKRVVLKVGANGLEVVIPRRFAKRRLPEIVEANRAWIELELQKVKEAPPPTAPDNIDLGAIGEPWEVKYAPKTETRMLAKEDGPLSLLIEGDTEDIFQVSAVLIRWLHLKAHAHLVPWLREVSQEVGIPYGKASVRGQTTRWASCSKSGNISLNRSLLFLPPRLVRHVFLHELCHIKELNHAQEFWSLLEQLEPESKTLESEVRRASRYTPQWLSLPKQLTS